MPNETSGSTSNEGLSSVRALCEATGVGRKGVRAAIAGGRVAELLTGRYKGYELAAFAPLGRDVAASLITRRLRQYERAVQQVEARMAAGYPDAALRTAQADYVLGRTSPAGTVSISCGNPAHAAWHIKPYTLVFNGTWCISCAGKKLKTYEEARAEVESRGGTLLSGTYPGANGALELLCASGHFFRKSLSKITNHNQWCPACGGSREEAQARHYLEYFLGLDFEVRRKPQWLREETGLALELDGLSEPQRVAFEYQGEHHYRQLAHFEKTVEEVQRRDAMKVAAAAARGYLLIVVPAFPRDYTEKVARGHVLGTLAHYVPADRHAEMLALAEAAPRFVRKDPMKLDALRRVVERNGDTLLDSEYRGFHAPHAVRCKCGRLRMGTPANMRRGGGCIDCGRKGTRTAAKREGKARWERSRSARLEALRSAAAKVGCTLLAEKYEGVTAPHAALCNNCGRECRPPAVTFFAGRGCPICGVERRKAALAARAASQTVAKAARIEQATRMLEIGQSVEEIAAAVGVHRDRVRQYLFGKGLRRQATERCGSAPPVSPHEVPA